MKPAQRKNKVKSHEIGINWCPSMKAIRGPMRRPAPARRKKKPPEPAPPPLPPGPPPGFCYLKDLLNRPPPQPPKKKRRLRPPPIRHRTDLVFRSAPLPQWPEEQLELQRCRLHEALLPPEEQDLRCLDNLMKEEKIQFLERRWVENSKTKISKQLLRGRDELISRLKSEAEALLEKGARLSVLRYRLLDAEWRESHGLQSYPWPFPLLVVRAPIPWRCSFLLGSQFCRHNLFTPHPVLRRLQALFEQRFGDALFVPAQSLRQRAPLTPQQLIASVDALCAEARVFLLKEWLPACADILSDNRKEWHHLAPSRRGDTLGQVERFFGCVAALMSRQLRLLTLQSLRHLAEILFEYKEGNTFTPPYSDLAMLKNSLLLLHLEAVESQFQLHPSPDEILNTARECMLRVLATANKLPRLEESLLGTSKGYLCGVSIEDEEASRLVAEAVQAVATNLVGPQQYLKLYSVHEGLINKGCEQSLEDFKTQSPSLKEWARYIESLQSTKAEIVSLRRRVSLNMVALECGPLNDLLCEKLDALKDDVIKYHVTSSRTHNRRICNEFDEMSDRAAVLPEDTAGLVALTQYLTHCQDIRMLELRKMIRTAAANLSFLVCYAIFPSEDVQLNARVFLWPRDMEAVFGISRQRLAHRREVVEAALRDRKASFETGLQQHQQQLSELQKKDPAIITMDDMRDSVQCVTNLSNNLERDRSIAENINEEEALLNWLPAPFSELHHMLAAIKPFQLLWTTVLDFNQSYETWYYGPFKELEAATVEARVRKMHAGLSEAAVALAKVPGSKRIAELTRSKIDQFILLLPLLHCVCTPGLCGRHWEQMSAAAGVVLDQDAVSTLAQVVEFGLLEHVALFQEVADCARQEMALHQRLLGMKAEWDDIILPCVPYRDAGVATLGTLDHIQLMLDDHILRAQTMHSSPFVRAFEDEMQAWEEKLISMQDIIDSWLICQALWLYLAPIFSSDDIMRQMPTEGAKFAKVDQTWRDIMMNTERDCHVLAATDMPNMLASLRECNTTLEQIQKGLNEYLEKKRVFFPRFYFLSNDELLEVLSETKDPCMVRLNKCFEGVVRIELGAEGEVTNVESSEGELLALSSRLVPAEAKGNVEKWLSQLEEALARSLKDTCREAVAAFQRTPRGQWALQWPSQAVTVAAAIHWTTEAAAALRNNEIEAFKVKCGKQIEELYSMVTENHPLKLRRTLTNLLQTDLHNLYTLEACADDLSIQGYSWSSVLRYYWREDSVVVSLANVDLAYGFEYLGCPSRLPLSPSTDSTIRSMVVAMKVGLGACLMGPAATGKTETCREAARMVARPFVVFSCSENLALQEVLKFLKGAVRAGAWLCLEGVDKLNSCLLSSLTQHLRNLGVASGSAPLQAPSCAVVTTAIKDIPKLLTAQFRPFIMNEPDVYYISRLILRANGFQNWDKLGNQLGQVFHFLGDLLPQNHHYDKTFRTPKEILQRCVMFLDKKDASEEQLLRKTIESYYRPRLSASDCAMFESVLRETFGETDKLSPPLTDRIKKIMESRGLFISKKIISRIEQLNEALEFKPAAILMGPALSGKTTAYQLLTTTISEISGGTKSIVYKVINPKALTLGRLVGDFTSSGEWSDGVLSSSFRDFSYSSSKEENKWLVLDGPVDQKWADYLNTALDETRTLCLTSGEMIKRSEHLRVIIECSDLNHCSPSLVGRCALINFEAQQGSWISLKEVLVSITLRKKLAMDEQWELISELIDWLTTPLLALTLTLDSHIKATDIILFNAFSKLYIGMLGEEAQFSSLWLQNSLLFSLIWGLGSTLTEQGRQTFDVFFRTLVNGENKMYPRPKSFKLTPQQLMPDKGMVFDWILDRKNNGTWLPWLDTVNKEPSVQLVGNPLLAIQRHFMNYSLSSGVPLLVAGPRGCGKSCVAQDFLQGLKADEYLTSVTNISGGTTSDQLQRTVVGRLDRRRKGVFGPPMGRRCVLLVDGLKEQLGPTELLRQWLGHGHWYDADNSKLELVDMVMIATCNDARNVASRLIGQVFVLGLEALTETALDKIFTNKLVDNYLAKGFSSNVSRMGKSVVMASLEVLSASKNCNYLQNASTQLFDIVDSMAIVPSSHLADVDKLSRLWLHETLRVLLDPLRLAGEQKAIFDAVKISCSKHLGKPLDILLKKFLGENEAQINLRHLESLHFGNFMEPDASPKIYDEICEEATLKEKVVFYLRDYLQKQCPLVLTQFILQHTTRICRVLQRSVRGHVLLVGEPGSGRTITAKISAIISGHRLFEVQPKGAYGQEEWKRDLKRVLKSCGPEDKTSVFLMRENILEGYDWMEDLSQLVSTGELSTLWDPDEKVELQEGMNVLAKVKGKKIEASSTVLYNYFVERVKANLHVVLVIASEGPIYNNTIKEYPPLIDNSAIDIFGPWPAESLTTIAKYYVDQTESGEAAQKCVSACRLFQDASPDGPQIAFLRLMRTFVRLHGLSSGAISRQRSRYISGLEKLDQAATQVIEMRKQLQHLRPQLVETSEQTERLMIKIEQDTVEVEARKEIVGSDEAKANEAAAAAQAIKDDCESDLAEAVPALEAALTALDTLKPSDITVVKAMKNPPPGVKLVLEAICVMKGVKPDRKPHPSGSGKMVEDFWAPSLRLIGEIKFLESLKTYEKDDIPTQIMARIRERYIHDREFRPEVVRKTSTACEGLCKWVRAIEVYDRVIKIVSPKKSKLAEAEAALALQMATLNEKRAQLQQVSDKLQTLNDDFAAMSKKKKDLEDNIDLCSQKLERAEKLIGGLGGETTRWGDMASSLEGRLDNVTGDVLMASATVTYLGGLDPNSRNDWIEKWSMQLDELGLSHSKPFKLGNCLGDTLSIRQWHLGGLSEDPYAVESALIATNCDAWPLLIDPDGQGVGWVKSHEKQIVVANTSHPEFLLTMEKAVQEGLPVLVDLQDSLIPPVLDSLLNKPYPSAQGARPKLFLGDSQVEVHDSFRVYLCLASPARALSADDLAKVTVVNFAMQPQGLVGRLLALVVGQEEPPLEEARHQLSLEGAANKQQLQEIEQKILDVLSDAETNILEDETGLQVLTASKALSEEISSKQAISVAKEIEIETARMLYLPVAKHGSEIFYSLARLTELQIFYQYSLDWFTATYSTALGCQEKESEDLDQRLTTLSSQLTIKSFAEVSPGLFQQDRLIFAFLLWIAEMRSKNQFDEVSWTVFLSGQGMTSIQGLQDIEVQMAADPDLWDKFKTSLEIEKIPSSISSIKGLARLALTRVTRLHDLLPQLRGLLAEELGESYLRPPATDLQEVVEAAGNQRPVIVALGDDGDPLRSLMKDNKRQVCLVSLGEGQERVAEEAVTTAAVKGSWVVLHNCHLASTNWAETKLERLAERALTSGHANFRLVLTFEGEGITLGLLKKGIKIAAGADGGIRSRVLHCFEDPDGLLANASKERRLLLLALSFMHSVAQARGLLSGQYFTDQDFDLSLSFSKQLEEWGVEGVRRAVTECVYGARTSDYGERSSLAALAEYYLCPEVLEDEAVRVARLMTPDLDLLEDDLAPETLHLSRSVRWTQGLLEAEQLLDALKSLFQWKEPVPTWNSQSVCQLKPIRMEKKAQPQNRLALVLSQEVSLFEKELRLGERDDLAERRNFLLKWMEGNEDQFWLGGASRPRALLRALAPAGSSLVLKIAEDDSPPLLKGVKLYGAFYDDGIIKEAENTPEQILPLLQFTNSNVNPSAGLFECPLFKSRKCRQIVGTVLLPANGNLRKWKLRQVVCYL